MTSERVYLVTAIADGMMAHVAARSTKELGKRADGSVLSSGLERMTGMMTMLVSDMAWDAEVIIVASRASDEFVFRENYNCVSMHHQIRP